MSSLKKLSREEPEKIDIFKRAFDTSPIGIALLSPQGVFLEINPALASMLGYASSTLKRKSFQDITHPDDLDKDVSLYKKH